METERASLETIEDFLAQKRIAMAGISRDPADLSVKLFEELCRHGYDVVPVNPNTPEVQGRRCFARLQDIQPPVEAALLMTSAEITETVVHDCAEAGIGRVWMYRGTGKGSVKPESHRILPGARDAGGSGPVSVHVSTGHCGRASLSRICPQDHGPLSASYSHGKQDMSFDGPGPVYIQASPNTWQAPSTERRRLNATADTSAACELGIYACPVCRRLLRQGETNEGIFRSWRPNEESSVAFSFADFTHSTLAFCRSPATREDKGASHNRPQP